MSPMPHMPPPSSHWLRPYARPFAAHVICMYRLIDSSPQKSSGCKLDVCNPGHPPASKEAIVLNMDTTTHISTVEKDSHDGTIATISDGMAVGYFVEELLMLRPLREHAHGASRPVQCDTIAKVGNSISAHA